MGTKFAEAFVEIGADLDRTSFGRMRGGIMSQMASIGKSAGAMLGPAVVGAIGVGAIAAGISKAVNLAREQIAAEKKLEAVLKATGGAAGFSADQLKNMAAELQKVTNYGDEVTISGMAVLATFKQIRGEQFAEAVKAAQDMAAVMGGDLQSSIMQIGKALNDPIQGLTALSRAGVTFTDDQKEMIRRMQEAGDIMGAQKIILAELKSQFGGAAQEMADPLIQLNNVLGDIGEEIGKVALPALIEMANVLKDILPAAVGSALKTFLELQLQVTDMISMFVHMQAKIEEMSGKPGEWLGGEGADPDRFTALWAEELDRTSARLRKTLNEMERGGGRFENTFKAAETGAGKVADEMKDVADATNQAAEDMERFQAAMRASAAGVMSGLTAGDPLEAFRTQRAELTRLLAGGTLTDRSYGAAMDQAREQLRRDMGVNLDDHLSPLEKYEERVKDLERLGGVGALTPEQLEKEKERAKAEALRDAGLGEKAKKDMKQGGSGGFVGMAGLGESIQQSLLKAKDVYEKETAKNTKELVEQTKEMKAAMKSIDANIKGVGGLVD